MKIAVIGHVEWGRFVRVDKVPVPGEITHTKDSWHEVAGGGAVAAMQLAQQNRTCAFFTAVGDDQLGHRALAQLKENGVEVYASVNKDVATKDIFVHIDDQNERTITVTGSMKPDGNDVALPWHKLAEMDAVYFVSGNQAALLAARQAKVLVSTARVLPLLKDFGLELDALVCSKNDSGEQYDVRELNPKPKLVVTTDGVNGGVTNTGVTYEAEAVSDSEFVDSYGCGDSFAAGLTFGLGQAMELHNALQLAAQSGAQAARRRGSFGNGFVTQ